MRETGAVHRRVRRGVAVTAGWLLAAAVALPARAGATEATGQASSAFGPDGTYVSSACAANALPGTVAVQSDGKVLVACGSTTPEIRILRLTAVGAPDPSFGTGGIASLAPPVGVSAAPRAIALAPGGKIVVAGDVAFADHAEVAVLRLDGSGTPDPTFGGGGWTVMPAGDDAHGTAVGVGADGSVAVGGTAIVCNPCVSTALAARVRPDGTPDGAFDGDGLVLMSPASGAYPIVGAALQPTGKVLIAGAFDACTCTIARFATDGRIDPTFGTNGFALSLPNPARSLAVGADGRLFTLALSDDDARVAAYTSEGDPIGSFGSSGVAEVDAEEGASEDPVQAVVDGSGRVVILSSHRRDLSGWPYSTQLQRLTSTGAIDTTFGFGGRSMAMLASDDLTAGLHALAIAPGGGLVATGGRTGTGPLDLVVGRFDQAGILDAPGTGTADLSIEVTAEEPDPVPDGEGVRYTVEVSNMGAKPISHALVTFQGTAHLQPDLAYVEGRTSDDGAACWALGAAMRCGLGIVGSGSSVTLILGGLATGAPGPAQAAFAVANLNWPDPVPSNDAATESTPITGPAGFTITVARNGTGSGSVTSDPAGISCPPDCSQEYAEATLVTLTAAPDAGSAFSLWSGLDEDEAPACQSHLAPCEFEVYDDRTVTATFTAFPSSSPKPDALLRPPGSTVYVGNDVYNTTGANQTKQVGASRGSKKVFFVKIQNDGTQASSFTVKGPGTQAGLTVRYLKGAAGSTVITSAVKAGTYTTSSIQPGAFQIIRLEVTVSGGAASGLLRSWLVTVTSAADQTKKDAVKAQVKVT